MRGLNRGQLAWAFFDWATQPYFTLILTFIFAPYFATRVVGDAVAGQALWGYLQAGAGLIIAFASPVFGAIADRTGRRKPWCAAFSAVGCLGACGLWLALPGAGALPGLMMILASIGFEVATVFNNAFLAHLASKGREGWLSGFGWGIGYVGGVVALGLILYGAYLPADPWFGLDKAAGEDARIVGPFSAAWFIVFALPFFLLTPDAPGKGVPFAAAARAGLAELRRTLRQLPRHRSILRFLVACMIYTDGLIALFSFGGIFAAALFGWGSTQLGIFGITTLVCSALGSFPGGWMDDRLGSRRTVIAALCGLGLGIVVVLSLGRDSLVFGLVPCAPASGHMTSPPEIVMMAAAAFMGLCAGPAQAASRTLMLRLTPADRTAEFFGLFAFSGKATAFVAPLVIGVATDLLHWQGASLIVVLLFMALGGGLLLRVAEPARL